MPRGTPSIPTLQKHGAGLLQQFQETDSKRTDILRDLAKVVVGIRAQFQTPEGKPDWAGQTGPYREAISAMYAQAEIPPDSVSNVQASLRYHVSTVLREVAPTKELTAIGLSPLSSADKQREANKRPTDASPEKQDTPADPEACIRLALMEVESARQMPAPTDVSACLVLLTTLEHACQQMRTAYAEAVLAPAPAAPRRRTRALQAA